MTASHIKISNAYDISSNSPEKGIDEEKISHIVKASDEHEIVVLKPIIDKMKINFSGLGAIKHTEIKNAYEYWEGVYGLAKDALKDQWFDNVTPERIARYQIGMKVELDDGAGAFTMGMKPYKKSDPAVSMEFNPSKFDYTEASRVFRRLLFVRRSYDERYKEEVFA